MKMKKTKKKNGGGLPFFNVFPLFSFIFPHVSMMCPMFSSITTTTTTTTSTTTTTTTTINLVVVVVVVVVVRGSFYNMRPKRYENMDFYWICNGF